MSKDIGLIIAAEGGNVEDDKRKLVFDSRDDTFKFLNRKDKGGILIDDYGRDEFFDTRKSIPKLVIPHNLGYPPYFSTWYAYSIFEAESGDPADEGVRLLEEYADINITFPPTCDDKNIYIDDGGDLSTNIDSIYLLVGTYNLESPPDLVFYIS